MDLDHNSLPEIQIKRLVNDAAAFIQEQRQKYIKVSKPISASDLVLFKPFFPEQILKMARFISVENEPMETPHFLKELVGAGYQFPDVNLLAAITFIDVVVYRKDLPSEIMFHELVHVMQYQNLGIGGFADKYFRGLLRTGNYEKIPLEVQAYDLHEKYFQNPMSFFSVEKDVKEWNARGSY